MSYYEQLLEQFSVNENAVNCDKCPSTFKCCTYRPFIANFLAGKVFSEDKFNQDMLNEWDMLIVGLTPSVAYRKFFLKNGKWGFGTEEKMLCSFYEKKTGHCGIWSSRPSVCRTFFCKSSYSDQGMSYWKKTEEFFWRMEWVLLEDFLFEEGWTLEDVALIKKYLDEGYLKNPFALPNEFRFSDINKAKEFYSRARQHIESLSRNKVMEIMGDEGRLFLDLVAEKAKIS